MKELVVAVGATSIHEVIQPLNYKAKVVQSAVPNSAANNVEDLLTTESRYISIYGFLGNEGVFL